MIEQQYYYSRLTSETVSELISQNYDTQAVKSCVFYVYGLHDNYLIQTKDEQFFVRIYRGSWRSAEEINFELELLSFLGSKKQPVPTPLRTKKNDFSFEINCPEGKRRVAVFTYAEGVPPDQNTTEEHIKLLGRTVAKLHNESQHFQSDFKREALSLEFLVDRSLQVIKPFLNKSQSDYLTSVKTVIETNLAELESDESSQVVCVGDVNLTNFHLTKDNKITLFDFDQCGYGQRAFEIGKFFSSIHFHESKEIVKQAFLQGYEEVHKLRVVEKKAIPYYELASVIWVMSIRVDNADKVGHSALDSSYWSRRIGIIEEMVEANN